MSRSGKIPHVVLAAVRDDGRFKAVQLRKRSDGVEIAWAKDMTAEEGSWSAFADRCGLNNDGGTGASVVGVDSTAVAFYTINAPKVGPDEMAAIVQMQAESLLPLPSSQIEVAWRAMPSTNGTVDVTLAAVRRDYLRRFSNDVKVFAPGTILPASEGLARSWYELFSEREHQALVVSINALNTQICLVIDGQVANAAVLDTGMEELSVVETTPTGASQTIEIVERFAQDMQVVLRSFGRSESNSWPIFVLSEGSDNIERIVEALKEAGVDARTVTPKSRLLGIPAELGPEDVYAYRVPIGLGLMALDGAGTALDLCRRLNAEHEEKKVKSARYSTTLAGIIAAIMLIALVVAWYLTDVTSAKRLNALVSQTDFEQARQHQVLLKTIARYRPDLLALLTDINTGEHNGIILDGLHFKKGQLASVTGQADKEDQMWAYQQYLLEQKSIEDVEIASQAQDPKTKKIKFTMNFHYKSFTKKGAGL